MLPNIHRCGYNGTRVRIPLEIDKIKIVDPSHPHSTPRIHKAPPYPEHFVDPRVILTIGIYHLKEGASIYYLSILTLRKEREKSSEIYGYFLYICHSYDKSQCSGKIRLNISDKNK